MSGHSKWSKVKHQKESTDAVKGKVFTKMGKAITVAIQEGGGNTDPNFNFKLRLAIEKARQSNMPKDNIQRAIDKAKGGGDGMVLQEILYEAFGPSGIGILIKAATDNKQRTVADIKNILDRAGGVLATSGAVIHMFTYVGLIHIEKGKKTYDELFEKAILEGATDIEEETDTYSVYTNPNELHKVAQALSSADYPVSEYELFYRPMTNISIPEKSQSEKIIQLLHTLEDHDDVDKVFANVLLTT